MKKFITALIIFISLIMVAPLSHAYNPLDKVCTSSASDVSNSPVCKDNGVAQDTKSNAIYGPNGVLTKAIRIVSIAIGIIAVIVIIIAGMQFILSSGDSAKVSKSKDAVLYASIGLAVAGISQAIVIFVLNRL